MAKKTEMYKGKPVFVASNSKKLSEAVAKYEGKAKVPYVVKVGKSTKHLKAKAFHSDSTVGTVLLPDSLNVIHEEAFCCCKNLAEVQIPDSVEIIGDRAFSMCTSLSTIHIPDSVTTIGPGAFHGCTSLTSISIPDSVTEIGEYAFADCTALKEIHINNLSMLMDAKGPWDVAITSLNGVPFVRFVDELEKFAAKYPDRKVACQLDNGTFLYLNALLVYDVEYGAVVLGYADDVPNDTFTVSDILNIDTDYHYCREVAIQHFTGSPEKPCFNTIAELKSGIFFKARDGGEDIIAFRPGFVCKVGNFDGEGV